MTINSFLQELCPFFDLDFYGEILIFFVTSNITKRLVGTYKFKRDQRPYI